MREECSVGARLSAAASASASGELESTTRWHTPGGHGESKNTPSLLVFAETLVLRPRANGVRRDAVAGRPVGKGAGAQQTERSGWPNCLLHALLCLALARMRP